MVPIWCLVFFCIPARLLNVINVTGFRGDYKNSVRGLGNPCSAVLGCRCSSYTSNSLCSVYPPFHPIYENTTSFLFDPDLLFWTVNLFRLLQNLNHLAIMHPLSVTLRPLQTFIPRSKAEESFFLFLFFFFNFVHIYSTMCFHWIMIVIFLFAGENHRAARFLYILIVTF